jgi:hypothetical protein
VTPGIPAILDASDDALARAASWEGESATTSLRRLALARWIASADNPLTARVIVNRVWQFHFGKGIVRTPSDFGVMGDPPTHPELLDWLANRSWSCRSMVPNARPPTSCVERPLAPLRGIFFRFGCGMDWSLAGKALIMPSLGNEGQSAGP